MKCVGSDIDWPEYIVGYGLDSYGQKIWIGYLATDTGRPPSIYVQINITPGQPAPCLNPREILEFRMKHYSDKQVDGKWKSTVEIEPPGWFERKCRDANCEWFVPLVKRMATGEIVPLEEIQAAYLAHNGKPMPCGKWSEMFPQYLA